MAKATHVVTRQMPPAPGREGAGSTKITTQAVKLPRNVAGQNREGLGKHNA